MSTALVAIPQPERPTTEQVVATFLDSCQAENTRTAYSRAIRDYGEYSGRFSRPDILAYISKLQADGASSSSINQRLAALRRLAMELADNGWLSPVDAVAISKIKGVPQRGRRTGNWLTKEQAIDKLNLPDRSTHQGRRDSALLAMLIGGGLRRDECVRAEVAQLQSREGRWLLADLQGKGHRTRTVPLPDWAATRVQEWITAAGITEGPIIRNMRGEPLTGNGLWRIVRDYAAVAPHDLRRTFGVLFKRAGGEWEALRDIMGHADLRTTQGYVQPALSLEKHALDGME